MKLVVKNFGQIKEASIDLHKRFYVFVGYNNSGKTYMAQLFWALENPEYLREYVLTNDILEGYTSELEKESGTIQITQEVFRNAIQGYAKFIQGKLPEVFNLSKSHFLFEDIDLGIEVEEWDWLKAKERLTIRTRETSNTEMKVIGEVLKEKGESHFTFKLPEESLNSKKRILDNFMLKLLLRIDSFETIYMPASRSFFPSFYQYVYKKEKQQSSRLSELLYTENITLLEQLRSQNRLSPPFTKPIDKLLEKTYQLSMSTPTARDWYSSVFTRLESIMGGKVKLQRNEAFSLVNFQLQVNEKDSLDMYMASSSANQLTTLYLYFKYWVFPRNNFLILDEPEENLHPKLQEEITWLLYRFAAQNNNRVIFTTHSPTVAQTVNIIDKFAELSTIENLDFESIAEEKEFPLQSREELLAPDDIGVYFFSGREVVPYAHDEYGVHFSDFHQVTYEQRLLSNKVADIIYNHSKDEDNG